MRERPFVGWEYFLHWNIFTLSNTPKYSIFCLTSNLNCDPSPRLYNLHFLCFHFWAFIFSARAYCIPCRSGEEWVCLPSQHFLEELYVHRSDCLLTSKLPNCERKTCSVFLLPLFHLLSFFYFWRLWKHCWDEKLPPPLVCLSAAWDLASYGELQEMREKIPPTRGPHRPCLTSHTYSQCTGAYFYCFSLLAYEDSSSPLFLSTPLFTHLPPITSHQTVLGRIH